MKKQLEIKLSDCLKNIQKHESLKVEEPVVIKVKCRECQYEGGTEVELRKHKRQQKN